jgi:hypothetical protein
MVKSTWLMRCLPLHLHLHYVRSAPRVFEIGDSNIQLEESTYAKGLFPTFLGQVLVASTAACAAVGDVIAFGALPSHIRDGAPLKSFRSFLFSRNVACCEDYVDEVPKDAQGRTPYHSLSIAGN